MNKRGLFLLAPALALAVFFAGCQEAAVDGETGSLTRVTNTNLSPYIPVPVTGVEGISSIITPQYTGRVVWKMTVDGDTITHTGAFVSGMVYTAVVNLTPNPGYTFDKFAGKFTHTGASSVVYAADSNAVAVAFDATADPRTVSLLNLSLYLAKPVTGGTPAMTVVTFQYIGTVGWEKTADNAAHSGLFAAYTAYTATVSLYPAPGYILDGLTAASFTHDGASSVVYDADSNVVKVAFDATADLLTPVTQTNLTTLLGTPVTGQPLKTTIYTDQYIGTVKWEYNVGGNSWLKEEGGFFAPNKKYRAKISLTLLPGYTLPDGNPFTHGSSQQEIKVSGNTVTVEFNATAVAPVTDYNLEHYVPLPVAGQIPVTNVARTDLTAVINWYVGSGTGSSMPPNSTFAPDTVYTAVITLYRISVDYEFKNSFTYTAGTVTSQAQDSGNDKSMSKITVIYKKIDAYRVTILDLAPYLPPPAIGEVPTRNFTTSQYTGSVQWKQGTGAGQTFFTGPSFVSFGDASSGGYIAVITLRALPGYQFPSPASFTDFTYTTPDSIVSQGGMPNPSTAGSGDTTRTVTIRFLWDLTP